LTGKPLDVGGMSTQQPSHFFGSTVAYAQPDNLWWRSAQNAEAVKVFIFRDKSAPSFLRQPPHRRVGRPTGADFSHVQRLRQNVSQ